MNVPEFLDYMMGDFGIPCESTVKSQLLMRLNHWLLERYRLGETAVLIVDEAHNLSDELLEEIRLLSNLETASEKLLQIVLVGQPELEQKLRQPHLRQLRQRIMLRAKTQPLSLSETESYIAQRLTIAGSVRQDVFDQGALILIQRYSGGIPRVVNLMCEHCLVTAFVEGQKIVRAEMVEAISIDLDLQSSGSETSSFIEEAQSVRAGKFELLEALKVLGDQLRYIEQGMAQGRKA
jgi:type II secretory pathway predicted ATPase ExeA